MTGAVVVVFIGVAACCWALCAAAGREDDRAEACSREWIRQQTRARGLTGYSGSYHEDR